MLEKLLLKIKDNKFYSLFFLFSLIILFVFLSFSIIDNINLCIPKFVDNDNLAYFGKGLCLNFSIPQLLIGLIGLFILFILPEFLLIYLLFFSFIIATRQIDVVSIIFLGIFFIKSIFKINTQDIKKIKLPFVLFFSFFILSCLLSLFNSSNILYSLVWIFYIIFLYFAYIVFPLNIINKKEKIFKLLKVFTFIGVISAVFGLVSLIDQFLIKYDYFIHGARPIPLFGNTVLLGDNRNILAQILLVGIISVLGLAFFEKVKKWRYIYLSLFGFMFFINVFTLSRNAVITISLCVSAIFTGIGFIKLIDKLKEKGKVFEKKKEVFSFLLRIGLILFISAIFLKTSFYIYSRINRSDYAGSIIYRTGVAEISFGIYKNHKFFGNGFGMYKDLLSKNPEYIYNYAFDDKNNVVDVAEAHSFLQKILVENGIFGIITFLLFLFIIFLKSFLYIINNKNRKEDRILMIFLLSIALSQIFFNLFDMRYYTLRMFLPLSLPIILLSLNKQLSFKKL